KATETQKTKAARSLNKPKPRDGIGPNSSNEAARLRARNEELEHENRRLQRENLALRSEVDELKAELAKRAPVVDDGLYIPPSLRREPARCRPTRSCPCSAAARWRWRGSRGALRLAAGARDDEARDETERAGTARPRPGLAALAVHVRVLAAG